MQYPTYRYTLTRTITPKHRHLAWVMLNPSTADDVEDDPTIRKVIGFTTRAGFDELTVVNLYPMRATKPSELFKVDEVTRTGGPADGGFAADQAILMACHRADAVVLAWGAQAQRCKDRAAYVEAMVRLHAKNVLVLGRTMYGHPLHPLMVSYSVPLVEVT